MRIIKKEMIAMLLAGGQGSRLFELTKSTAKPAVVFGGKYRIIDFTLSNCINSGIDTVGVLTQYQPLALNEYIGNGTPWDLDRMNGGVTLLPPYKGNENSDWYKGTANAIYQNTNFIRQYSPDYVLILAADHIYRMDYASMLTAHKKNDAVCTVATIEVDLKEASRFGICAVDSGGRIYDFEEKPSVPKGNTASMGIYIFTTSVLLKYLEIDALSPNSDNDFGKNIIPALINNGEKIYSYRFNGYWRDVGTIKSLWEANMDLVGSAPKLEIHTNDKIYSRNFARPPQYIGEGANVKNSLISEGCEIYGKVTNSVLSGGVVVKEGAEISNSVIFEETVINKNASVTNAIIAEEITVNEEDKIGDFSGEELTVVSKDGIRTISLK